MVKKILSVLVFGILLLSIVPFAFAGITGSAVGDEQGGIVTTTAPSTESEQTEDIEQPKEEFQNTLDGDCGDYNCDELEIKDGGTTPDSAFYFVDEFLDNFGDDLEVREEKVGEIKTMVETGNYEAAQKALENYKSHTENIEEIDPEKEVETTKSSITIEKTLREIENEIPEEYKKDFVDDVIEKEEKIRTAVKISSKIKDLCIQLAELDPVEYSNVCSFENDKSNWKKNMYQDLTEEQKVEAKKFGEIMSQCFKTSGNDCKCEDISFYDFSVACDKVAPLASKCDAGSEDACRMIDEIEMPDLPDYLQDIFDDIERKYGEAKYSMHMPKECIDAGVKDPKECGKIMIKENAPIECRQALLDANVQEEREGRKICDKIMFEQHAPMECKDKGITNPEECKKLMESKGGPKGSGGFGGDCKGIQDPMKRLECFDNAGKNMGEQYGVGEKFQEVQGEITWQCKENKIHWPPDCDKFMREELPQQERMIEEEMKKEWEQKDDWRVMEKKCAESCKDAWDFSGGRCICKSNEINNEPNDNYERRDDYQERPIGQEPMEGSNDGLQYGPGEGPGEPGDYDNNALPQDNYQKPAPTITTTEPSTESSTETTVTGEVIKNRFLEYYNRK